MKRALKLLLSAVSVLAALTLVAVIMLISSTSGLQYALQTAERFVPELSIENSEGRLIDAFTLTGIRYAPEQGPAVEIASVALQWQPLALLRGQVRISETIIRDLHIIDGESAEADTSESEDIVIDLPVSINVKSLQLGQLTMTSIDGETTTIFNQLNSQLKLKQSTLSIAALTLERDDVNLQLNGTVDINMPYTMQLVTDMQLQLDELPELSLAGTIHGDIEALQIQQNSSAPLQSSFQLDLADLLGELGWQIALTGNQWKAADFVDEQTAVINQLQLAASGGIDHVSGTLEVNVTEVDLPALNLALAFDSDDFENWQLSSVLNLDDRSTLQLAGLLSDVLSESPGVEFSGIWQDIIWPYNDETLLLTDSHGQFSVAGDLDGLDIELSGQASIQGDDLIPDQQLQFSTGLHASQTRAEIKQFKLTSDDGQLSAEGQVDWTQQLQLSLDAGWQEIKIPDGLAPVSIRSPQGRLRLHGDEQQFELESQMSLEIDQQPLQVTVTGDGTTAGFETMDLLLQHGGATAGFKGQVAWQDIISVAGELSLNNFNPGILLTDWPGRLGGGGQIAFQMKGDEIQLSADKLNIEGELRQLPVRLQTDLRYKDSVLDVPLLSLTSGDSSLQVKGKMTDVLAFEWQLNSPDLSNFYPDLTGQLVADGVISGTAELPDITAQLNGQSLGWEQRYFLGKLDADISVREGGTGRLELSSQFDNIRLDEFELDQVTLQLSGKMNEHALVLKAKADDMQLDSIFAGALVDDVWNGRISKLDFDSEISGLWQLTESGPVMLSATSNKLSQHCWRSAEFGELCLQGQSDEQMNWQAQGRFIDLPLALANPFIDEFAALSGLLTGQFQLQANADAMPTGKVALAVEQGQVHVSELILDQGKPVNLETVSLVVNLDADRTSAEFILKPDMEGVSALNIQLDTADLTSVMADTQSAPLSGRLDLAIADLSVLNLGGAAYDDLTGQLNVNARLSGVVADPDLRAEVQLREAAVELIDLGIRVSEINSQVTGNLNGLEFNFSGRSGDGQLSGSGQLELLADGWQLQARLDGDQFELMNLPEAYVIAEPALRFEVTAESLLVRGDVRIPTAELAPLQFNTTVSASDDVVVFGREVEDSEAAAITTQIDVNVILGDAVRITAMGFNGRLTGQLRVSGDPNALLNGNGEIVLTDGSYDAYGQQLRVNDGRIRFSGAAIDNPELDIRAIRTGSGFTAGIHIHGPADNPQATLFSTPSMTQDNILSHILLGRPLMQANDSDAAFLASAATSLGIRNGAMIGEQIASSFGLDSFSVSGDTPETTAVEIGKFLSPRLYVSYGIGVFEPVSTMQLRYTLSRLFTLRAESGLETGVDLLYTYERR